MSIRLAKPSLSAVGILSAIALSIPLVGSAVTKGFAQTTQPTSPDSTAPGAEMSPDTTLPESSPPDALPNNSETSPNATRDLSQYTPDEAPILSVGSTGEAVADVQSFLRQAGLYNGEVDSMFGPQTRAAVISFQQQENLSADGIIGPQTWEAMVQ